MTAVAHEAVDSVERVGGVAPRSRTGRSRAGERSLDRRPRGGLPAAVRTGVQSSRSRAGRPRQPVAPATLSRPVGSSAPVQSCRVAPTSSRARLTAVPAPVASARPAQWRLTERGLAVVMGLLALLVVLAVVCVVGTFVQVTSA